MDARVVDRFDSITAGQEATKRLRHSLTSAGVRHVVLPRPVVGASAIAVSVDDQAALDRAFDGLGDQPEWVVRTQSGWRTRHRPLARWAKSRPRVPNATSRVLVFQALATETGLVLSGECEAVVLEFWSSIKDTHTTRTDGGFHVQGTRLAPHPVASVPYLTPAAWDAAEKQEKWPTHLFDVIGPVDVVYTWVDGSDPEWVARRNAALRVSSDHARHLSSTAPSRFANHDELRYSLRSVEMYANWVRRIHIVTDGQQPDWLDVDHPKINLVDHRDIFSDPSVLPVFNSHAIESQLHHIPGLAEQYLYLNDDVYFGRPVRPELFFEGNGLTRFFTSVLALDIDPASARDMPVLSAAKNNREFLLSEFGRTVTRKFRHTPHPQNRVVLAEFEQRFPEMFAAVASSTFRDPADVSIAASLAHYYAYATGRSVPGELRAVYRELDDLQSGRDLERVFTPPGNDVFCINEVQSSPGPATDRALELVKDLFATHFPLPSSFERNGSP